MTARNALLEVDDLRVQFPTRRGIVRAVEGVSFTIDEGEPVGLVGETGCGKSATVRALIGLLQSPGRVVGGGAKLEGDEILHLPHRVLRRIRGAGIGFVPQNPFNALNPVLRIERQFRNVVRAHRSATRQEVRDGAREMLDRVGIPDPDRILRGYAHELSGGMAQRLVIAIALSSDPKLLIADEPTTGLDLTIQRQILDMLGGLVAETRRSMLLVTHDLGVVAHYCSRVIVMYAGTVVEVGPVATVLKRPAHPYTQALLDAVPRRGEPLRSLPGSVPDAIDYPIGCAFYERCPLKSDARCETERPPLREIGPGHSVAAFCLPQAGG